MKVKVLIIFLFLVNLFASKIHASGDVMGNGGGLAEQNLVFAYKNIPQFIDVCLNSDDCHLSLTEKKILLEIQAEMPNEYLNGKLVFKSETKNPGTFLINGELKIAKTYLYVGAPIFINKDLLYQKNRAGKFVPYSMAQATALLIHELAHHLKYTDHTALDLLGSKVAMLVDRQVEEVRILPGRDDLKLMTINFLDKKSHPIVLLYIGEKIINISEKIKKEVTCSLISLPLFGPVHWSRKKPISTILHNLSFVYQDINERPKRSSYFALKGSLLNFCMKTDGTIIQEAESKLTIDFSAYLMKKTNDIQWEYKDKSILIKQVKDSWWHFLNIPII